MIKLIQKHNYFLPQLANLWVNSSLLDSFDIENIKLEPILFQAGYLSILESREAKRGGYEYSLHVPNKEAQLSFNDILIDYLTDQHAAKGRYQDQLYTIFENGDIDSLKNTLSSLFASIPYNNYVNNTISSYEGYFSSVIYAYPASLGLDITGEDVTSKGRIDLTIKLDDNIYIIEFKVDGKMDDLQQIREKNYQKKYLGDGKNIFLIGIDFSSKDKNVSGFAWEQLQYKK